MDNKRGFSWLRGKKRPCVMLWRGKGNILGLRDPIIEKVTKRVLKFEFRIKHSHPHNASNCLWRKKSDESQGGRFEIYKWKTIIKLYGPWLSFFRIWRICIIENFWKREDRSKACNRKFKIKILICLFCIFWTFIFIPTIYELDVRVIHPRDWKRTVFLKLTKNFIDCRRNFDTERFMEKS